MVNRVPQPSRAGSFGFLFGPIAGGIAVELTRQRTGVPAYDAIFIGVGACVVVLGLVAAAVLAPIPRAWRAEDEPPGAATVPIP